MNKLMNTMWIHKDDIMPIGTFCLMQKNEFKSDHLFDLGLEPLFIERHRDKMFMT